MTMCARSYDCHMMRPLADVHAYLRLTGRKVYQFLFAGRGDDDKRGLTTRQYARLVQGWVSSIGLDPAKFDPATCVR